MDSHLRSERLGEIKAFREAAEWIRIESRDPYLGNKTIRQFGVEMRKRLNGRARTIKSKEMW